MTEVRTTFDLNRGQLVELVWELDKQLTELRQVLEDILADARSSLPVNGMYPNMEAFYRAKVNRIAGMTDAALARARTKSDEEVEA